MKKKVFKGYIIIFAKGDSKIFFIPFRLFISIILTFITGGDSKGYISNF